MPTMTLAGAAARPSQDRPRQKQPQQQRTPGRQERRGGRTTAVGERQRQRQSEEGERRPSRSRSRTSESRKSPSPQSSSSSNGRSRSSSRSRSQSRRRRSRSKSCRKSSKDANKELSSSSRSLSSMDEDSALKVVFAYLNEEDAPGPNSWRKHGHSKRERLLSGEPSTTSVTTAASHHVPIHRYYAMADKVLSAFTGAFHATPGESSDMHRLDDAFVYGHRALVLLLKTLPTHPMYRSEIAEYKALRKTSLSNVRFVHRNMRDIVEQMDKKEFNIVRYKDMERRMSGGTAGDTTNGGGVGADVREPELKAFSGRNGAMIVEDDNGALGSTSSSPAFEVVSSPWREKVQSAQRIDDFGVGATPAPVPVTPVRGSTNGNPPGTPRGRNVADSNDQWETLLTPVPDDDEETMCTFKSDAAIYRRNAVPKKSDLGGRKGSSNPSSAAATTPDGHRRRTTQTTKLSSPQKNKRDKASDENSLWNAPSFSFDEDESRSNPEGSGFATTQNRVVTDDDGGDAWNLAVTSTFSFDSKQEAIKNSPAKSSVEMPENPGDANAYGWNVADASTFSFDDEQQTTRFGQSNSAFATPQRSKNDDYGWSNAVASSFSFDDDQSSIDDSRSSIGGDVDFSSVSNVNNNEVRQVFGDFAEGEESSTWPTRLAQRTMSNSFTDDDSIAKSAKESPSGLHDAEIELVLAVADSRYHPDQDERDDADYVNRRTPTPTSLIDPPHLERFANDCVENLHWIDDSQEESMESEQQGNQKNVAIKSGLSLGDPNYHSKEKQRWNKPQNLATEHGYAGSDDNYKSDRNAEDIVSGSKATMDNRATSSELAAWRSSRRQPSATHASFAASPSNSRAPLRDLSPGTSGVNKIAGEEIQEQLMPPASGRAMTTPNSTQSDLYSRENGGSENHSSTGRIENKTKIPTSYVSPARREARMNSFSKLRQLHESENCSGSGGSGNSSPRAWTREQSNKPQTHVSPTKGRTPPLSKSPLSDLSANDEIGDDSNGNSTRNAERAVEKASTKPTQTKNPNFKSLVQQWEKRNGPPPSPANFPSATQAASSRASSFDISSPDRRTTASVTVGVPRREAKIDFHNQSDEESSPISDHASSDFQTQRSSSFQTSSDIASRRITQDVSLSMGTPASSFKPVGSASTQTIFATNSHVSEGNSDFDDNVGASSNKRLDVARMIRQREERKGGTPRNQVGRDATLHDSDVPRAKQWKTKDYGALLSSRARKHAPQRYVNVSDQSDSGEQDATYRSHDEAINSPQKSHPKYEMPNDEIWRMKHGPTNSVAGVRKSPSSHATFKTADETLSHDMSDVSGSTSSYAIDNVRVKEVTMGDSTEFVQLEYVYQEDSFGRFNQSGGQPKIQGRNQSVDNPNAKTHDFETHPRGNSSSPPTADLQSPSLRKRLSDRFIRRNVSSTSSTVKQETPQSPSKRSSKFLRGPASGGLANQQSYKQMSSLPFCPPQMIVVGNDVQGQRDTEI